MTEQRSWWSGHHYSRIYYSIFEDPRLVEVIDDMPLFGAWVTLLMAADMAWPAPAELPRAVPAEAIEALVKARTIDRVGQRRFRFRSMDYERVARKERAENGGLARAATADRDDQGRFVTGNVTGHHGAPEPARDGPATAGLARVETGRNTPDDSSYSKAKQRRDETSRDETSRVESLLTSESSFSEDGLVGVSSNDSEDNWNGKTPENGRGSFEEEVGGRSTLVEELDRDYQALGISPDATRDTRVRLRELVHSSIEKAGAREEAARREAAEARALREAEARAEAARKAEEVAHWPKRLPGEGVAAWQARRDGVVAEWRAQRRSSSAS